MRQIQSTLLYHWFEDVWNREQEDSIPKMMADTAILHGILQPDQAPGATGFQQFYRNFKHQFEHIHFDIKDVVQQDDMEVALTDVTAIYRETGKEVAFSGLCMVRVQEGKIAEAWNQYDFLSLHKQIEAISPNSVLTPV